MDESRGNGSLDGRRKGSPRSSLKHSSPSSQGQKPAEAKEGVAEVPAQNGPCGACKFLRRKCVNGCIFAPYFGTDQGAAKFVAVHKVLGASNMSKLLLHVSVTRRHDAVVTICYQAQARLADPVYGCISTILALQQQVASVQTELALVHARLMNNRYAKPRPTPQLGSAAAATASSILTPPHKHPDDFAAHILQQQLRYLQYNQHKELSHLFRQALAESSSPNLETLRFSPSEEEEDDDEESIPAAFTTDFLLR